MAISKPVSVGNGEWAVKTTHGIKIFSDGETAEDFYLLNKYREETKSHGNSSSTRQ
jgi:hypothetical protein